MAQKDSVPPENPLSLTISQNGTTEATVTSIQLESVQEATTKAHSGELPLVSAVEELKHCMFRGILPDHHLERGKVMNFSIPWLQCLAFPTN